jgi:ferredoxin
MVVFAYGIWRRFKLWRQGVPIALKELFVGNLKQIWAKLQPGLRRLLVEGLGQKRVWGRGLASWAHVSLFAGFMMLFLGTTLLEMDHLASGLSEALKFHRGTYYVIYEFTLDVFGLLFLAVAFGFFLAAHAASGQSRASGHGLVCDRFVPHHRRERLSRRRTAHRLATTHRCHGPLFAGRAVDFALVLRPDGCRRALNPLGRVVGSCGAGVWFHRVHSYTRLLHILAGPLNLFFARPELGRMVPVSMEEVEKTERVGVSAVAHFNQQQLLSLDACMECGRCEEACPAYATAKPLSPKKVVQDLKRLMTLSLGPRARDSKSPLPALHDETIQAETLWSCTACSACVNVCPVRIDPLTLITDLRRNRVGEGALSGTAATALRRMQSSSNPWGLPAAERAHWSEGLGAPPPRRIRVLRCSTGSAAPGRTIAARNAWRAPW